MRKAIARFIWSCRTATCRTATCRTAIYRAATVRERLHLESWRQCLKNRHRFALLIDYGADGGRYLLAVPQPSRASMTCPPLSVPFLRVQPFQAPAGVRLEIVHNFFRLRFGFHDRMNVIRTHMGCCQVPATVRADFLQSRQYGGSASAVQFIGQLVHELLLIRTTLRVGFQYPTSWQIVRAVNGASFVAMQMASVAGESN